MAAPGDEQSPQGRGALLLSTNSSPDCGVSLDMRRPKAAAQPDDEAMDMLLQREAALRSEEKRSDADTPGSSVLGAFSALQRSPLSLALVALLSLVTVGLLVSPVRWSAEIERLPGSSSTADLSPMRVDGSGEQFVHQYELCPRPDTAEQDAALDDLAVNHFLQPAGPFSYASFNLSLSQLLPSYHPLLNLSSPAPRFVEVYVQEVFWEAAEREVRLACVMLAEGDVSLAYWHYDEKPYADAAKALFSELTLHVQVSSAGAASGGGGGGSSSADAIVLSATGMLQAEGFFWYFFRSASPIAVPPPASNSSPLVFTLHHPALVSASSDCGRSSSPGNNNTAAAVALWCAAPATPSRPITVHPSSGSAPFLRLSLCARRYRPVEFSYCSNVLHTADLMPHLPSFLAHHAYLGIHRFVLFDRGGYRAMLQPYIDAGLVEYRLWPWVNRRFPHHVDNWSQQAAISVCVQMHRHTSTYFGVFDIDEWLHLPKKQLLASELQTAQPVDEQLAAVLAAEPYPSDCLRFAPQPLHLEPALSLDGSAHAQHAFPFLHCRSMLLRLVWELQPRQQQCMRRALREQAAAVLLNGGAFRGLIGQRSGFDTLDVIPIRVYNFEERAADASQRVAREAERQQRWHSRAAAWLNSSAVGFSREASGGELTALPFHASCPQRFRTRRRSIHDWHKAFHRSAAAPLTTWVHPRQLPGGRQIPDPAWVNPNVLRFHHFVNIFFNRTVWANGSEEAADLLDDASMLDVTRALYALNGDASLLRLLGEEAGG